MIEQFHKPKTMEEAIHLKNTYKDQAVFLAGGLEVNNLFFPLNPTQAISLEGLGLKHISKNNQELLIGANVTVQELLESELMPEVLKQAVLKIVNRNIRNRATLGGHIATNKSCSDLLPTLIVMQARLVVESKTVSVYDYISQEQKGLITEIILPLNSKRTVKHNNYTRAANDISVITAAVSFEKNNNNIHDAIIAVGGMAKHVVRLTQVEDHLNGKAKPTLEDLEALARAAVNPITDIRGSAAFKKYEISVMVGGLFYAN